MTESAARDISPAYACLGLAFATETAVTKTFSADLGLSPAQKLWGKLKFRYRKLMRPSKMHIFGVSVDVKDVRMPKWLWNALARESYEAHEIALIRRLVRPGSRVLELGSGLGVTSLVLASIAGAANVFCFDANPEAVRAARRSFRKARQDIYLRNRAAVSGPAQPPFFDFYPHDNILSSSTTPRDGARRKIRVPTFSLEDFLQEHAIDTLIIGIEGGEVELLSRAASLDPLKLIIMEVHPHVVGEAAIAAMTAALQDKGFVLSDTAGNNVQVFTRRQ